MPNQNPSSAWTELFKSLVPNHSFTTSFDPIKRTVTLTTNAPDAAQALEKSFYQQPLYAQLPFLLLPSDGNHDTVASEFSQQDLQTLAHLRPERLVQHLLIDPVKRNGFNLPLTVQSDNAKTTTLRLRVNPQLSENEIELQQQSFALYQKFLQKNWDQLSYKQVIAYLTGRSYSSTPLMESKWATLKSLTVDFSNPECVTVDTGLLGQLLQPPRPQRPPFSNQITFDADHIANHLILHAGDVVLAKHDDGSPHPILVATPRSEVSTLAEITLACDVSTSVEDSISAYTDAIESLGQTVLQPYQHRKTEYLTFASTVSPIQTWNTDEKLNLNSGGSTALYDAIRKIDAHKFAAANHDDNHDNTLGVVIVITDGEDNRSENKTIPSREELKFLGHSTTKVFFVGVGNHIKPQVLHTLSTITDTEALLGIDNFDALKKHLEDHLNQFGQGRTKVSFAFSIAGSAWQSFSQLFESAQLLHAIELPNDKKFVLGSRLRFGDIVYEITQNSRQSKPGLSSDQSRLFKLFSWLQSTTMALVPSVDIQSNTDSSHHDGWMNWLSKVGGQGLSQAITFVHTSLGKLSITQFGQPKDATIPSDAIKPQHAQSTSRLSMDKVDSSSLQDSNAVDQHPKTITPRQG